MSGSSILVLLWRWITLPVVGIWILSALSLEAIRELRTRRRLGAAYEGPAA